MVAGVPGKNFEIISAELVDNNLQTPRTLMAAVKQNDRPFAATRLRRPVAIKTLRSIGAPEPMALGARVKIPP